MTKQDLQKELKDKVKPGVKPSDLRKLKRSKSADDITTPPTSIPVSRSKSSEPFKDPKYPYTTLISQQEELDKLKKETETKSTTISLLRKKNEELEQQIKNNPPAQLLQDQLLEKQQQLEQLRQQLATKPTLTELDNSLFARHQNLKAWFSQYSQKQQLDQELAENINEASNELITQDQTISNLRGQISQLKTSNQSLSKDLSLSSRLAELRKDPHYSPENHPYLKYALYTLAAVWFSWFLSKNLSPK